MSLRLKFCGYYRTENQTMRHEEFRIEEAKVLADQLNKSFTDVTDCDLLDIINSNAVLIFRDKTHRFYCYFPYAKIARVTEVVYNPKDITKALYKFGMWFNPGEQFKIGDDDPEKKGENTSCFIHFEDINNECRNCNHRDFRISTHGGDFLIHLENKTYALDWGDESISISNLSRLIKHKWIYLYEYDTNIHCSECDGYSYDNCDMDRCKHNCEKCGGRKYICNNSCFYYRNNTAIVMNYSEKATEELYQAINIIDCACKPFSLDAEYIKQQYSSLLDSLLTDCSFVGNYIDCDVFAKFTNRYNHMRLLFENRHTDCAEYCKVRLAIDTQTYLLRRGDLKVKESGWIWKDYHVLVDNAYDYISDSLVTIEKEINEKDKNVRRDFVISVNSGCVSEIQLIDGVISFKK